MVHEGFLVERERVIERERDRERESDRERDYVTEVFTAVELHLFYNR